MERFLVILLDLISFGTTKLLRKLVKKRKIKSSYHIDIDGDGKADVSVKIHSEDHEKEE